jgi:hypothetical protein
LSIVWGGVSASAETLRCQSVNGNLNCAGSQGVACQTINGKKVCVGGGGGVEQSFGNHAPADNLNDPADLDDEDLGKVGPTPGAKRPHSRGGHAGIPDRG